MQNLLNLQNLQSLGVSKTVQSESLSDYIKSLSGLVAYYPLDETSGNAINQAPDTLGTLDGTVTGATQGVAGQVGKAYSFDGVNDRVDVDDNAALQLTDEFTLLSIIDLDDYANFNSLINKFTNDNNCEYHWRVQQTSGEMYLQQGTGSSQTNYTSANAVGTDPVIISVTLDADNVIYYKNGVGETPQNTSASEIVTTNSGVRLGARNDGSLFLKGDTQHFCIFNRVLTSAEQLKLAQLAGLA